MHQRTSEFQPHKTASRLKRGAASGRTKEGLMWCEGCVGWWVPALKIPFQRARCSIERKHLPREVGSMLSDLTKTPRVRTRNSYRDCDQYALFKI